MVDMFAEWSQLSSSKETPFYITRIFDGYVWLYDELTPMEQHAIQTSMTMIFLDPAMNALWLQYLRRQINICYVLKSIYLVFLYR